MIGVGAAPAPVLAHPGRIVLVFIPEFFDELPDFRWCFDLLESHFSVIGHLLRLPEAHRDPIPFCGVASIFLFGVIIAASLHELFVAFLDVSEVLDWHALVLFGRGVVGRVCIVRKPGVIGGDLRIVHREG